MPDAMRPAALRAGGAGMGGEPNFAAPHTIEAKYRSHQLRATGTDQAGDSQHPAPLEPQAG